MISIRPQAFLSRHSIVQPVFADGSNPFALPPRQVFSNALYTPWNSLVINRCSVPFRRNILIDADRKIPKAEELETDVRANALDGALAYRQDDSTFMLQDHELTITVVTRRRWLSSRLPVNACYSTAMELYPRRR